MGCGGTATERWWRRRPGGFTLAGHEFMGDPTTADAVRIEVYEVIERYRAARPGDGAAPVELQLNAFPKPEPTGAGS